MSRLRVLCFSVSLDGYGAGPDQSLADPLGRNGESLHNWVFPTRSFRAMHTDDAGGTTGTDNDFAIAGFAGIGAWILGRNMFTHERGPWMNDDWKGWWGDTPPYHCDVFVLTHHARAPIEMKGGTTFHFVTEGLPTALSRARAAARGQDIRLGGGVATVREGLTLGLVDDLHLAVAPVLLGAGENLFAGLDLPALGYAVTGTTPGEGATHVTIAREAT